MKLTDSFIKAIKPQASLKKIPDGDGLTLFSYPNGLLSWRYRYRFNGKEKMLSIWSYPENERAINVYAKLGFKKEGVLLKEFFVDGAYRDAFRMAIFQNEYLEIKNYS